MGNNQHCTQSDISLTYGSVCSGIEAATVAWHELGWRAAWFSEIDAFPSALLAYRWPDIPNLGDMTRISSGISSGKTDAPDVLVGGTPCQAFSMAGKRKGLSDPRGQLSLAFVELANQIDLVRQQQNMPASIVVWENVTGVLSSHDNAFGCFLGALAGSGCALQPAGKRWTNAGLVSGPSRTVAWRVLNAQYFGVAQSRRRVFVVASAGERLDPGKVLFESSPLSSGGENYYGKKKKSQSLLDEGIKGELRRYCFESLPDRTGTIIAGYNGTSSQDMTMQGGLIVERYPRLRVRRLTPEECERLQGFPVGYTDVPYKNASPSHRYKAIGNSMPVPVMKWIGRRIQEVLAEV
ncbi:DNA cytosine methyltransferase [Escherichia coli]|uniref:DNA cytosine methyltransferase n=1 Tax=Escherichia coli TaxID=562 RepID=UPI000BE5073D|nr:DNA cytosine methyltransferase [Escherichia coli]ELO7644238.1 DNA cytosine methyltransferase [Escherichia coli]